MHRGYVKSGQMEEHLTGRWRICLIFQPFSIQNFTTMSHYANQ